MQAAAAIKAAAEATWKEGECTTQYRSVGLAASFFLICLNVLDEMKEFDICRIVRVP